MNDFHNDLGPEDHEAIETKNKPDVQSSSCQDDSIQVVKAVLVPKQANLECYFAVRGGSSTEAQIFFAEPVLGSVCFV